MGSERGIRDRAQPQAAQAADKPAEQPVEQPAEGSAAYEAPKQENGDLREIANGDIDSFR